MAALRKTMLSRRLRAMRLAAGMSQTVAGQHAGITDGAISHFEVGRTVPTPVMAQGLAVIYGASPEAIRDIGRLAKRAAEPGWWEPSNFAAKAGLPMLMDLEDVASSIAESQPELIPGLLQTDRYARALLTVFPLFDQDDIESTVAFKAERRHRVLDREDVELSFLIAEGALWRAHAIDEQQVPHLLSLSDRADIKVLPTGSGAHAAMAGGYMIVHSTVPGIPPVVYMESASGSRYEEDGDVLVAHRKVWHATASISVNVQDWTNDHEMA